MVAWDIGAFDDVIGVGVLFEAEHEAGVIEDSPGGDQALFDVAGVLVGGDDLRSVWAGGGYLGEAEELPFVSLIEGALVAIFGAVGMHAEGGGITFTVVASGYRAHEPSVVGVGRGVQRRGVFDGDVTALGERDVFEQPHLAHGVAFHLHVRLAGVFHVMIGQAVAGDILHAQAGGGLGIAAVHAE